MILSQRVLSLLLLFSFILGSHQALGNDDSTSNLGSVIRAQENIQERTTDISERYRPLIEELRSLGLSSDYIVLLESVLNELSDMSESQMAEVTAALSTAMNDPDNEEVTEQLARALRGQRSIAARLRGILSRIEQNQQEMAFGREARALAERIAANRHMTEMLAEQGQPSEAAEAVAQAEQAAIQEAVNDFAARASELHEDGQTPSAEFKSLASPEALESLQNEVQEATAQMEEGDYEAAADAQENLQDTLSQLATLDGQDVSSSALAQDQLRDLEGIIADQKSLLKRTTPEADLKALRLRQDEIAIQTDIFRSTIEATHAGAAHQVRRATEQMRVNRRLLQTPQGVPEARNAQARAIQALEAARDYLQQQAEFLESQAEADMLPDSPEAELDLIQKLLREAKALLQEQEKLNANSVRTDGATLNAAEINKTQNEIIRRSVILQNRTQPINAAAATAIGQAVVKMAAAMEANQNEPDMPRRTTAQNQASQNLATAVELLEASEEAVREEIAAEEAAEAAEAAAEALAAAQDALDSMESSDSSEESDEGEESESEMGDAESEALETGDTPPEDFEEGEFEQMELGTDESGTEESDMGESENGDPEMTEEEALDQAAEHLEAAQEALDSLGAQTENELSSSVQEALEASSAAMGEASEQLEAGDAEGAEASLAEAQEALSRVQGELGKPMPGNQQGDAEGTEDSEEEGSSRRGAGGGGEEGRYNDVGRQRDGIFNPADRDSMSEARREPVPPGYRPFVDTYFENLSELDEAARN